MRWLPFLDTTPSGLAKHLLSPWEERAAVLLERAAGEVRAGSDEQIATVEEALANLKVGTGAFSEAAASELLRFADEEEADRG